MSKKIDNIAPSSPSPDESGSAELSAVVEELLSGITTKFSHVSSELLSKMDEMSRRLDALEATIQASANAGTTSSKGKGKGEGEV